MEKVIYDEKFILIAYDLARAGQRKASIAEALGIPVTLLDVWRVKHPALQSALERGRQFYYSKSGQTQGDARTLSDFIFNSLPPDLQLYWNKLNKIGKQYVCQDCGKSYPIRPENCQVCQGELFQKRMPADRIEGLFNDAGEKVRKWLFLYAWACEFSFRLGRALNKVNISRSTYDRWLREDGEFAKMVDTIVQYKKDFIEDAVFDLVMLREPGTVRFAAERLLKDRGYGAEQPVNNLNFIQNNLTANVTNVEQALTDVPLEQQKLILQRIRNPEAKKIASTVVGQGK